MLDRGRARAAGRGHLVDEADLLGARGADELPDEDQLLRARRADDRGQALGAAAAGHDAEADLGHAQAGALARHAQVAAQRELQAAAERVALDRRDRGHRQLGQLAVDVLLVEQLALGDATGEALELLDVRAGAERALAGAGDDHRARLAVGREPVERLVELLHHRDGHEVERLVVELEERDLARVRVIIARSPPPGPWCRAAYTRGSMRPSGSATCGAKPIRSSTSRLGSTPVGDLDQRHAVVGQREHRALGDEADLLAALARHAPAEGDLADLVDELRQRAVRADREPVAGEVELEPARGERADEVELPRARADVREAAGAAHAARERVHVDVAVAVDLGEREAGHVEPAAVVEVEHRRLLDHRLVVEAGAALVAGHRDAAEDPLLDGQHELVGDALLEGDRADPLADAEAEVADVAGRELEQGAAPDHLAHVERERVAGRRRPRAGRPRSRASTASRRSGSGRRRRARSRPARRARRPSAPAASRCRRAA